MSWFSFKKPSTPEPETGHELLALVRTMEDDITGREIPTEIPKIQEPLVSFEPHTTTGAPFYVAPGSIAADPKPSPESPSPFVPKPTTSSTAKSVTPPHRAVATSRGAAPAALPVVSPEREPKTKPKNAPQLPPRPVASSKPAVQTSQGENRIQAYFREHRMSSIIALGVMGALILAGGAGYFWWSRKPVAAPVVDTPTPPAVEMPEIEPAVKLEGSSRAQYSLEQPNILSFDTETITAESIKQTLLQVGQSIKQDDLSGAVEFLIRDQKLNPLALSRFAYLAKLRFPDELLGTLDESFSLYVVLDASRPRVVLLTNVKNEAAFTTELKRSEKSLAQVLEPLFLDVTTAPKTNLTFRDSRYLERPVRFVNVDASLGLSVDYAVREKQWLVGTSKQALRAVLDKTGL